MIVKGKAQEFGKKKKKKKIKKKKKKKKNLKKSDKINILIDKYKIME